MRNSEVEDLVMFLGSARCKKHLVDLSLVPDWIRGMTRSATAIKSDRTVTKFIKGEIEAKKDSARQGALVVPQ